MNIANLVEEAQQTVAKEASEHTSSRHTRRSTLRRRCWRRSSHFYRKNDG